MAPYSTTAYLLDRAHIHDTVTKRKILNAILNRSQSHPINWNRHMGPREVNLER